jgi:TP901 family phage tail tape measure protein
MADLERTVKVAFLGEDRVTKTIDGITGRIDSFAGRVSDATQPLANLTDNILKVEAALAAMAIGGLALAFNEFSKFESASAELAKVLDLQTESLDQAQAQAIEYSNTYGVASDTVLQSFAGFRQANFNLAESMTLTKDAIDLAIAGDMELAQATEIIISSLKGFKLGAEDARAVIDALNETSNNFATNATELGTGLGLLSPIARQMGFTFQETIGLLTPIIEVFRSGAEAGNALKTTLLKLQADRTADTLKELEISQKDANDQFRSGKDILLDVLVAFQGLGDTEKAYYAQQLTGIHQAGKAVEVFDQLEKVIAVTNTAMNSAGSAAREVEIRLETAEIQVKRFITALRNMAAAAGGEVAESFTFLIKGGTEVLNTFRELIASGVFDELFDFINRIATDLGQTLFDIAGNLEDAFEGVDFSKFIESMQGVIDEVVGLFNDFFGEVDLSTKEGLQKVIQRIVDSFTALNNVVAGILNAFGPFVQKIGELAQKFADLNAEDAKTIGNFLGWAKVINTVANNIGALTGSLNFLAQGLTVLTGVKILAAIKGLNQTGAAASGLMATITKLNLVLAAPFAGYWLGSILRDNIPFIKQWGDNLGEVLFKLKDNEETMRRTAAAEYTEALGRLNVAVVQWAESLDEVPREAVVDFQVGSEEYQDEYDKILKMVQDFPETKDTKLTLTADKAAAVQAFETIRIWVDDNESKDGGYWTELKFRVDETKLDDTKKALEEIPAEKVIIAKIENQTELEIARIQAGAATLQKAMEFKAQIEIAEVEQLFETLRTQSENIAEMFLNTGEVIMAMTSAFEHLGALGKHDLLQLMEKELEIRAELARQQGLLTVAEIAYLEAKTEALAKGEGFINITMDGVYPELELIMHKLIEQTQIRANAEGYEFLLGV